MALPISVAHGQDRVSAVPSFAVVSAPTSGSNITVTVDISVNLHEDSGAAADAAFGQDLALGFALDQEVYNPVLHFAVDTLTDAGVSALPAVTEGVLFNLSVKFGLIGATFWDIPGAMTEALGISSDLPLYPLQVLLDSSSISPDDEVPYVGLQYSSQGGYLPVYTGVSGLPQELQPAGAGGGDSHAPGCGTDDDCETRPNPQPPECSENCNDPDDASMILGFPQTKPKKQ